MNAKLTGGIALLLVVLLVFWGLSQCIVEVDPGQRAVVYNRYSRKFSEPLCLGYNFVLPLIHEITLYDTGTQVYKFSGNAEDGFASRSPALEILSSDGLLLKLELRVNYRVDEDQLNTIHASIGPDYATKIIRPSAREVFRYGFAAHTAQDIYENSGEIVSGDLLARLETSLAQYGFTLEGIELRDIILPKKVQDALDERKRQERDAERLKYAEDTETTE